MTPEAARPERRRVVLTVILALVAVLLIGREIATSGGTPVFADEFDGTGLDRARWDSGYPWGCTNEGNHELECYTPDALTVRDGLLHITADRRRATKLPFSSGMVTSYGSFAQRYGYFELRARLPAGKGLWPAFWLLPRHGESPPELDVMEHLGAEPDVVHLTQHYLTHEGERRSHKGQWSGPDFTAGFHTFGLSWSPDRIAWFVDGTERFASESHIPDEEMYLLVNLAVGGDWPGPPDDRTRFPSVMLVDYVRVWRTPRP
jgi:beta-glucanase (GH16 family)